MSTPSTTPERLTIVLRHLWTNLKLAEKRYTDAAAEALLAHASGVYRLGDAAGSTPHAAILQAARHLVGEWWNAAEMADYTAFLCGEPVEPDMRRLAEAVLADASLRAVPYSNDDIGEMLAAAEQVTGRAIGTTIVKDELRNLLEAVGEVATRMRMLFLAGALRRAAPEPAAAAPEPAEEPLDDEDDAVEPAAFGVKLDHAKRTLSRDGKTCEIKSERIWRLCILLLRRHRAWTTAEHIEEYVGDGYAYTAQTVKCYLAEARSAFQSIGLMIENQRNIGWRLSEGM